MTKTSTVLRAMSGLLVIFALGCDDSSEPFDPNPVFGEMTDSRDQQTYNTVTLGDQTWLAENLNHETEDSWCYDDDPANCEKYGRLYTWQAALTACPDGWSPGSKEDWVALSTYLDPDTEEPSDQIMDISEIAGEMMKATGTEWTSWNAGATNIAGFSVLPAGNRDNEMYTVVGFITMFWTATETDDDYAWTLMLDAGQSGIFLDDTAVTKDYGLSVRCILD